VLVCFVWKRGVNKKLREATRAISDKLLQKQGRDDARIVVRLELQHIYKYFGLQEMLQVVLVPVDGG
jgi:hypothetical protein